MSSGNSPSPSEPTGQLDLSSPVPGTWALVGLMLAVHVLGGLYQVGAYGFDTAADGLLWTRTDRLRTALGGQSAGMVWAGDAHQLWTSVMVHTDALHLLTNVVAIFALGRLLEPLVGGRRVWAWFWIGGVLASLSSWGAGVIQSDGASGGAFALLGAAAVIGGELRRDLVPEDARLVGPVLWFFLGLNILLSVVLPFVDLVAHLAGLLAGLLLGGAVGTRKHWLITGFDWFWLFACLLLVGIGWFQPDLFRPYYWNVWMVDQSWFTV